MKHGHNEWEQERYPSYKFLWKFMKEIVEETFCWHDYEVVIINGMFHDRICKKCKKWLVGA
jgi:hypothetical protein